MSVEDAIRDTFVSMNVPDSNLGPANLVDVGAGISRSLSAVADAIKPRGVTPGTDASGGMVDSLTEAVMGVTVGLHAIADALNSIAAEIAKGA